MAARRPDLTERVAKLEEQVKELISEMRDVREKLLKELARALHGPSLPPPPPQNDD